MPSECNEPNDEVRISSASSNAVPLSFRVDNTETVTLSVVIPLLLPYFVAHLVGFCEALKGRDGATCNMCSKHEAPPPLKLEYNL